MSKSIVHAVSIREPYITPRANGPGNDIGRGLIRHVIQILTCNVHYIIYFNLVRDSSAVRRLFSPDLLETWDVSELYIRKTAELPMQLCLDTFPRFVAIGFYFLAQTII